jgi:ribosomal protein L14E/L6E/L27E
LKQGKVVIVLNGRFAGRKGIIVKAFDENQNDRSYGHCLIAGIDRYPLKVTKDMKSKRFNKRSKVKPFVRMVNYNHIMPTRYVPPPSPTLVCAALCLDACVANRIMALHTTGQTAPHFCGDLRDMLGLDEGSAMVFIAALVRRVSSPRLFSFFPFRSYSLDVDLKDANKLVVGESYTNTNLRQEVKKTSKKQLEERYVRASHWTCSPTPSLRSFFRIAHRLLPHSRSPRYKTGKNTWFFKKLRF